MQFIISTKSVFHSAQIKFLALLKFDKLCNNQFAVNAMRKSNNENWHTRFDRKINK